MQHDLIVEIISKEMVKPSLVKSSHPEIFTLSLLDQIFPAFHIPVLLFYTSIAPPPQGGCGVDINRLKESLSQTLDQFYPLAGQFSDESTVCCNDHGVPFFVTKVNCPLSDVLGSPQKLKLITKFLPPQELQADGPRPISEVVPLSIQINVLPCGGVVIGCYALHKLLDALSIGTFLKHWSAIAAKREDGLMQPDYEAAIKAFPPLPEHVFEPDRCNPPAPVGQLHNLITVVKSFRFSPEALRSLRAKAASDLVPRPSRFEALAGFVWEHMMLATASAAADARILEDQQQQHTQTEFSFTADMRSRMNPALPKASMGNIVTMVKAQTDTGRCRLQELVQEIHSSLSSINQKIAAVYQQQGKNGVEILRERKAESQGLPECDKGYNYQLSSLSKVGWDEADFGFGKPSWILPINGRPVPPELRNFIFFTDYKLPISGEFGIEAWLFLEEKEMQVLESNQLFLAFASPN